MQNNPLPYDNSVSGSARAEPKKRGRGANRALKNVRINISIQPGLLDLVEEAAEKDFTTRSDIIRTALLWYLRPVGSEAFGGYKDEQEALYELIRRRKTKASFHREREQLKRLLDEEATET